MLFYSKRKQRQLNSQVELIDGLKLSKTIYAKSENRIYTLLLKALIVFFISSGVIGCVLTSTSTMYNELLVNTVLFILSILVSICYYNKTLENLGNISYLILLIIVGFFYAVYINSGFYSWMNDVIGIATEYFNLPDMGGYTEKIQDSSLTVTLAALYIGSVTVIIANMTIAKKMHHVDLLIDVFIVMFFSLYLEREPKFAYAAMLILGVVMTFIWRMSGQYLKLDNDSLFYQDRGHISYTYNIFSHSYIFVYIGIIISIITLIFTLILPKDTYNYYRSRSALKNSTDGVVSRLVTSGIWSFFNRYENTGGMNSGRLGGVNSVRLDYETDLYVTIAPYDNNSIYIRNFIGSDYVPYNNYWNTAPKDKVNDNEYVSLYEYGAKGGKDNSTGIMLVENIAASRGVFMPYYSNNHDLIKPGENKKIQYCPLLILNNPVLKSEFKLSDEEREFWTRVPEDNIPIIDETIINIGISDGMNVFEVTDAIYQYYFDNIPYTLRPGSTPRRKDFINYFLDTNKKGYCAHFASAATLMFRELGIPARYVEGYAIGGDTKYELVEDADYSKFYYGYKKLTTENVLKFDVTDANAHAWVEVYIDNYGWIPVELTPPSSDTGSTFDNIMNLFRSDVNDINDTDTAIKEFDYTGLKIVIYLLLLILVIVLFVFVILKEIKLKYIYINSNINDKLIYKYKSFIRKNKRKKNRIDYLNYNQTISELYCDTYDNETIDKIILILNKAGFSNKLISEEEFEFVIKNLK